MSQRNIHQQIEELERERAKRTSVFAGLVSRGKLRQVEADEANARLDAAIATLRWCRDNRELIAAVQMRTEAQNGGAR